jgi:hypothetical protein
LGHHTEAATFTTSIRRGPKPKILSEQTGALRLFGPGDLVRKLSRQTQKLKHHPVARHSSAKGMAPLYSTERRMVSVFSAFRKAFGERLNKERLPDSDWPLNERKSANRK